VQIHMCIYTNNDRSGKLINTMITESNSTSHGSDDLKPRATPCTCHMIRRTARQLNRFYDQTLKPVGLTLSQYSVLAHTDNNASLSVTELAALTDADRTTLTRNLQPMIQAGWIEIGAGADKRSRAVRLTDAGRDLFRRAYPLWQKAEREFRNNMGKDEAKNLRQLLDGAVTATTP